MSTKKGRSKKQISCEDNSGLFIPAGIFIGMGIGFLIDALVAGLFIGMGIGFAAMAIAKLIITQDA